MHSQQILEIKDLKKYYRVTSGLIPRPVGDVKAVDGVSLTIAEKEVLGAGRGIGMRENHAGQDDFTSGRADQR